MVIASEGISNQLEWTEVIKKNASENAQDNATVKSFLEKLG